ncbi:hypothetical protein SDC9_177644 [bioreactor metagenome]|uniref:Uncharacterized protein n=1 Tax=bioreactor metagenome TaxID=1076179 RepID=A0A645GVA1_9ZZZZ
MGIELEFLLRTGHQRRVRKVQPHHVVAVPADLCGQFPDGLVVPEIFIVLQAQ